MTRKKTILTVSIIWYDSGMFWKWDNSSRAPPSCVRACTSLGFLCTSLSASSLAFSKNIIRSMSSLLSALAPIYNTSTTYFDTNNILCCKRLTQTTLNLTKALLFISRNYRYLSCSNTSDSVHILLEESKAANSLGSKSCQAWGQHAHTIVTNYHVQIRRDITPSTHQSLALHWKSMLLCNHAI